MGSLGAGSGTNTAFATRGLLQIVAQGARRLSQAEIRLAVANILDMAGCRLEAEEVEVLLQ
jgi:hypothetical protein